MPTWLAVQQSKAVFFLTLYDSINDNKYFRNCLHHTSAVPQPFLLLIAVNLALHQYIVTADSERYPARAKLSAINNKNEYGTAEV